MDIAQEIKNLGIGEQEYLKLQNFVALLAEWNEKMNLVSKNSFADVWVRHVLDSAQLITYLPKNLKHLVDIGSGAGFPAIVLAILVERIIPEAKLTLVESITKKTVYLNDVVQKLGLKNVEIINDRVENIGKNTVFKDVDVITARAVAQLDVLCSYAKHIGNANTKLLLLKGQKWAEEDTLAQNHWQYDLTMYPNKYCLDGVVMELLNLRKKR
ncbi:MAG: 16S rRNA (guanine(527)-N(7))-methyltransferase RsmG [Alphaproteobacteria bacterium]|nr:16S rRNA (guanine(527)-N(7))-methyltransferase RsmG [Alphaproteobacteria bacterium]